MLRRLDAGTEPMGSHAISRLDVDEGLKRYATMRRYLDTPILRYNCLLTDDELSLFDRAIKKCRSNSSIASTMVELVEEGFECDHPHDRLGRHVELPDADVELPPPDDVPDLRSITDALRSVAESGVDPRRAEAEVPVPDDVGGFLEGDTSQQYHLRRFDFRKDQAADFVELCKSRNVGMKCLLVAAMNRICDEGNKP